jgi:hypothetical protein
MIGFNSNTGKYQVSLRIEGELVFIGEYGQVEEASAAESAIIHDARPRGCFLDSNPDTPLV